MKYLLILYLSMPGVHVKLVFDKYDDIEACHRAGAMAVVTASLAPEGDKYDKIWHECKEVE